MRCMSPGLVNVIYTKQPSEYNWGLKGKSCKADGRVLPLDVQIGLGDKRHSNQRLHSMELMRWAPCVQEWIKLYMDMQNPSKQTHYFQIASQDTGMQRCVQMLERHDMSQYGHVRTP
jgi:hypothetical protein